MMGLLRKDNPAEKKLKELTGGFILSTSFNNRLKRNNLTTSDGIKIKNQLKNEIKEDKLHEQDVESRLNQLISERGSNPTQSKNKKSCSACQEIQDSNNTFCINCGHKFSDLNHDKCPHCGKEISEYLNVCPHCNQRISNKKTCPICNKSQYKDHKYCINCGYDFIDKKEDTTKNVCPNCQNVQSDTTIKCLRCGYNFKTKKKMPKFLKKCPECLILQKSENMYCRNCKHDLKDIDYEDCNDLIECSQCKRMIPKNNDKCPFADMIFTLQDRPKSTKKESKQKLKNYKTSTHNAESPFCIIMISTLRPVPNAMRNF